MGQEIALFLQSSHFRFEQIKVTTEPGLPAIKGAGIEKKRTPDLLSVEINDTDCQKLPHAPIEA